TASALRARRRGSRTRSGTRARAASPRSGRSSASPHSAVRCARGGARARGGRCARSHAGRATAARPEVGPDLPYALSLETRQGFLALTDGGSDAAHLARIGLERRHGYVLRPIRASCLV